MTDEMNSTVKTKMKFIQMKNILPVIISLFVIASCSIRSDNCSAVDPISPMAYVTILDSEGNSLLGEDNFYKPSEITLTRNEQEIPLLFDENQGDTIMVFYYNDMRSQQDYLLKLNDVETDIVNLKLSYSNSECFGNVTSLDQFFLNGEELLIDENNYFYVIEK